MGKKKRSHDAKSRAIRWIERRFPVLGMCEGSWLANHYLKARIHSANKTALERKMREQDPERHERNLRQRERRFLERRLCSIYKKDKEYMHRNFEGESEELAELSSTDESSQAEAIVVRKPKQFRHRPSLATPIMERIRVASDADDQEEEEEDDDDQEADEEDDEDQEAEEEDDEDQEEEEEDDDDDDQEEEEEDDSEELEDEEESQNEEDDEEEVENEANMDEEKEASAEEYIEESTGIEDMLFWIKPYKVRKDVDLATLRYRKARNAKLTLRIGEDEMIETLSHDAAVDVPSGRTKGTNVYGHPHTYGPDGYDTEGHDCSGFDKDGKDYWGYDLRGMDSHGRNLLGFKNGFNVVGERINQFPQHVILKIQKKAIFLRRFGILRPNAAKRSLEYYANAIGLDFNELITSDPPQNNDFDEFNESSGNLPFIKLKCI